MSSSALQTIEDQLSFLSHDELLLLIERIARQLRKANRPVDFAAQMEAMAADPDIQAEMRCIEAESSGIHEGV